MKQPDDDGQLIQLCSLLCAIQLLSIWMINLQGSAFIFQLPIKINQEMTKRSSPSLMELFDDPKFAWDLLEWQIAIEMNQSLSGQAIAKLLQLYMRGVQKMNSLVDIRQSYFKNKVTSLMMRGNVVKTLNKPPPMAKKSKPLEVSAKIEEKPKVKSKDKVKKQAKLESVLPVLPNSQSASRMNSYSLQQKRKQIEMRLAYESQQTSRENIGQIYVQHIQKEEHIQAKIVAAFNDHETKLQQRINRRKLKTSTFRSRPQNTNDTSIKQMDLLQDRDNKEEMFISQEARVQEQGEIVTKKRFKSLQSRAGQNSQIQSKRARKYTFDFAGPLYENGMTISITTLMEKKKSTSCKKLL